MANEQTSVPLYAASEILTAANMNISAGTGVPVFATTVTRDAAFGGANEKVLAEGQLCYLSATNVVQYYDGAAWATVGPAAASGLVCVQAETAFSAVASVTADSVFTSTFTNYRVIIRYTTSAEYLDMRFRVAGVDTSTNYNFQEVDISATTVSAGRNAAVTAGRIGHETNGAYFSLVSLDISGPQLAEGTAYFSNNALNKTYALPRIIIIAGNQSASTSFDGVKFLVTSGTMTGSFTIYGYSETV